MFVRMLPTLECGGKALRDTALDLVEQQFSIQSKAPSVLSSARALQKAGPLQNAFTLRRSFAAFPNSS